MAYTIIDPPSDRSLVGISQKVRCEATGSPIPVKWKFKVNAGAFTVFDGSGLVAVLGAPASVANQDAGGSKGCDTITIRVENNANPADFTERTLVLVSGIPSIDCASPMHPITELVKEPAADPLCLMLPGGLVDGDTPSQGILDSHGVRETVDEALLSGLTEATSKECCGCASGCSHHASGGGSTLTAQDNANAGLVKSEPMFCNLDPVAMASRISQTLPGRLQVRTGCGMYRGKGQTLDLGTFFASPADGLASTERIAGTKRMFGWWARLIKDTTGNVAIYWGDRTIEGWRSIDTGLTFQRSSGVFGTLTWDAVQMTYTRGLRDGTIYVFDQNGRLLSIEPRERSLALSMTYNGLNQITGMTGGGLGGFTPAFTYDANRRMNLMELQAANSAYNRVTYYDYDGSGRMNKVIGPEGCITYFDYANTTDNLTSEINPDNYRTYFAYNGEKVIEVNLPESAAIYFTYDDTAPDARRTQKDGTQKTLTYNWAGMSLSIVHAEGTETFTYDSEARPSMAEAVDGVRSYYTWDAVGQSISQRFPDDTVLYFTHGNAANVTSKKDALGRVTYWNYDLAEYPSNWIDAFGNTTYYERDGLEFLTSIKNRRGNVTYYTWDSFGNRTSSQWADGSTRYYEYNPGQELEVIKDELGNVSYFDRDKRGRITAWKDFDGKITQFAYDNRSNLTTRIDRRSNAWYWEYDGLSRNTVQRTALLNTSYFRYSSGNLLSNTQDPRGNPGYFYYSNKRRIAQENALKEITYFTYTSVGLLESVKDARGATQYFTYDSLRRRISSMDGERNVSYFRFDKIGSSIAQTEPRGFTTYFFPDELNRRFARRNPLDQVDYFYFDAEGNTFAQENALQRRNYFYFDSRNRRFATEDAQGNQTYFTYDARSFQSSSKDARGNVTYFYQNALGRRFAKRDSRGSLSYFDFDAEGNAIASKDARSNTTYYTFDEDYRRLSIKSPLLELTYFTFDAAANRTSVKDARGNLSYFYFDALNRVNCEEDAKRARTYFTFNASGDRTSVMDPLARTTTSFFDLARRNFAVQGATGGIKYYSFDRASNFDSLKNERGNVTYFYFDALNRQFAMRNPLQALSYFEFDEVGNRISSKDAVSRLAYFYFDSLNRMIAWEDGLQRRTYFEFDAVGNMGVIKNPRRSSVSPSEVGIQYFTFNELNRRSSLKDEVGQVWYFDYDNASNMTFQRNPRGAFTYFEFDAENQIVSQHFPLSRTWYWTYDPLGNASSLKDGKAQVTYYQHDVVNLRERIDFADTTKHYFEYDLARQMTAIADPTGRTTESYDSLGRLTFRGNPGSQNLYYEYDAVGNRTSMKDPDGVTVYYALDAADRMKEVSSTQYGGWISYYEYDLADEMVHERRANGAVTYHGYDTAGRVSLIQHRKGDGTLIERYDYTRDEVGNILQQIRGSDSTSVYWNYDQASRITKEAWRTNGGTNLYGFEYSYDETGNRLYRRDIVKASTTYWEYDLGDQMTLQRSGATVTVYFTFDDNGNLSVEHDVDPFAGRTYFNYEPRNLLSRVDFPGATPTNYFYYNAGVERIRKDDSTGAKKYTWDGIVQVLEKDLTNTTLQRLVKGYTPIEGIGEYTMQDLANTIIYPHKNQVGTTQRHTDSGQVVVNYYEYDAWGKDYESHQSVNQEYRYTGKELNPDRNSSGTQVATSHFPFRTIRHDTGSFLQIDPLLLSISHHLTRNRRPHYDILQVQELFSYAHANPLVFVDPLALQLRAGTGSPVNPPREGPRPPGMPSPESLEGTGPGGTLLTTGGIMCIMGIAAETSTVAFVVVAGGGIFAVGTAALAGGAYIVARDSGIHDAIGSFCTNFMELDPIPINYKPGDGPCCYAYLCYGPMDSCSNSRTVYVVWYNWSCGAAPEEMDTPNAGVKCYRLSPPLKGRCESHGKEPQKQW